MTETLSDATITQSLAILCAVFFTAFWFLGKEILKG